jgi:hypothetical protein
MIKKALTALAVAGALVFAGSAAANAYSVTPPPTVEDSTLAPGASTVITVTGLDEYDSVVFAVTSGPSGATLSSIVATATLPGAVTKPVVNGTATATFTATTEGTYTVGIFDTDSNLITSTSIQVSTAFAGGGSGGSGGGTGGLPATGGELPLTAIWLGVGAVGIGGIAVVAAVARRRAQTTH